MVRRHSRTYRECICEGSVSLGSVYKGGGGYVM